MGEMEEVIQRYGGLFAYNLPAEAEESMLMPLKDDVADEAILYFAFQSGAALRCDYPSKELSDDHNSFLQNKGLSGEHYTFLQRDEVKDTLDEAVTARRITLEPQIADYMRMRDKLQALEDAERRSFEAASSYERVCDRIQREDVGFYIVIYWVNNTLFLFPMSMDVELGGRQEHDRSSEALECIEVVLHEADSLKSLITLDGKVLPGRGPEAARIKAWIADQADELASLISTLGAQQEFAQGSERTQRILDGYHSVILKLASIGTKLNRDGQRGFSCTENTVPVGKDTVLHMLASGSAIVADVRPGEPGPARFEDNKLYIADILTGEIASTERRLNREQQHLAKLVSIRSEIEADDDRS